jgi:hypothetical protein
MLDRRFRYQYRYNPSAYGHREHTYEVIGRDGAIHFHVTEPSGEIAAFSEPLGGLEYHRRTCPDGENRPPSHHNCPLLGGICWHDGTSLYASEVLIPRWRQAFPNHDAIFGWLIREFDRVFSPEPEAA